MTQRYFILLLTTLLLSSCINSSYTCYIKCGDNPKIVISDVKFQKVEKILYHGKLSKLQVLFSFKSNYDIEEAKKEYSAVTFSLRVPMFSEKNYSKSILGGYIDDKPKKISVSQYEYEGGIYLEKSAGINNYQRALDVVRKHGGFPLVPTMARLHWGPSLLRFKPVLLEFDVNEIKTKPEEWEKY